MDPRDPRRLRRHLLAWFDAHGRDLPWRGSRDPYAIWVSEVMLQQTRVETVRPYHARWMARFPTVEALAAADGQEVLALWSGLGYYRRARALHAAARQVVEEGGLPEDPEGLRRLPGIGPYASGAIASIAFGHAVPAVDGNAVRVLARLDAVEGPATGAVRRGVEARAAALVDPARPGDWNQALMDLGSLVCTPRAPRCGECPWQDACRAEDPSAHPARAARRPPREEAVHFAYIEHEGRVLLVRNPDEGLLGGTWRLPGGPADQDLVRLVREDTGLDVRLEGTAGRLRHVFTHRRWSMEVFTARPQAGEAPVLPGHAAWRPLVDLADLPLSTAMRKAIARGAKA